MERPHEYKYCHDLCLIGAFGGWPICKDGQRRFANAMDNLSMDDYDESLCVEETKNIVCCKTCWGSF